nr:putative ORF1 [Marmot picobirnavirus]
MTRNQLDYWARIETARSNRAQEALKGRELSEIERHNRAGEDLTSRGQDLTYATAGFDRASREGISSADRSSREKVSAADREVRKSELAESIRHNQASESIQAQDANTRRWTATLGSYADRVSKQHYTNLDAYNQGQLTVDQQRARLARDKLDQDVLLAELERDLRRELQNREITERQLEMIVGSVTRLISSSGGVFNFFKTLSGGNIPVE